MEDEPINQNYLIGCDTIENSPSSLPLFGGLITRSRLRDGKWEKSVLDFFVVCSRVLPFVTKMVIDERKQHILTNYSR